MRKVSSVVNVLDAITIRVVAGSSGFTASSNAAPSMLDRKRTLSVAGDAAERVEQQRRAKHGTADADVQDPGDITKGAGLDRVDQRAHPLSPRGGEVDVMRCAAAALGDMGRGAALARIDDLASEQGIARGGKAHRFGTSEELIDQALVEMRFRPIEIEAGDLEAEPAEPVGFGGEQLVEPLGRLLLPSPPHIIAGAALKPPRLDARPGRKQAGRWPCPPPAAIARPRLQPNAEGGRWLAGPLRSCCCHPAWAFRSFVVAPFSIPSGSMLPTLYIGDYLAVAKWPYGYSRYSLPFGFPPFEGRVLGHLPERGDVVVFRHPGENADLIKRVIGLPGDTIAVRGGR